MAGKYIIIPIPTKVNMAGDSRPQWQAATTNKSAAAARRRQTPNYRTTMIMMKPDATHIKDSLVAMWLSFVSLYSETGAFLSENYS